LNPEVRYNMCRISCHYFFELNFNYDERTDLYSVMAPNLIIDSFIHYSLVERKSKTFQISLNSDRFGILKEFFSSKSILI
jgi:hypothetical protein